MNYFLSVSEDQDSKLVENHAPLQMPKFEVRKTNVG